MSKISSYIEIRVLSHYLIEIMYPGRKGASLLTHDQLLHQLGFALHLKRHSARVLLEEVDLFVEFGVLGLQFADVLDQNLRFDTVAAVLIQGAGAVGPGAE